MFKSLRSFIITSIIVITSLAVTAIVVQQIRNRELAIAVIFDQAKATAERVSYTQQQIIKETETFLIKLSESPKVQSSSVEECSGFLRDVLNYNNYYVNIGAPLASGDLLCNALPLPNRTINVFDRPYFQRSLTQKEFAISEFQFDRAAQKTSVNFSYPVVNEKNEVVSIVVAVLSLDWWSHQLGALPIPDGSMAFITDADRKIVAIFPEEPSAIGLNAERYGLSNEATLGLKDTRLVDVDGIRRVYYHASLFEMPDGRIMTLSVGIPADQRLAEINQSFMHSLMLLMVVVAVFSGTGYYLFAIKIFRPLGLLLDAMNNLKRGYLLPSMGDSTGGVKELLELQHRFQDMAEIRVKIARELTNRNEELDSILRSLPDDYFRINSSGEILDFRLTGQSRLMINGVSIGSSIRTSVVGLNDEQFDGFFAGVALGRVLRDRLELDQSEHSFEFRISEISGVEAYILIVRDLTEQKNRSQEIWQQANFDPLTSLPNRNNLTARLETEIKLAKRSQHSFALLTIDLDNFKEINDSLGHQYGDQVLQIVAQRLTESVRETDFIARLGGDEFMAVLSNLSPQTQEENVQEITRKILNSLSQRLDLGDVTVFTAGSIGVAFYPSDATNVDELFKMSDQAMYGAKTSGRSRMRFFDQSMQISADKQLFMSNGLHDAIEKKELEVYFQPIVSLQTGKIKKVEALLRWFHPIQGEIPTDDFIPILERSHLMAYIGDWVFKQCVEKLYEFKTLGFEEIQISINISPAQITHDRKIILNWPQILQEKGLKSNSVIAEITEGLLLSDDARTDEVLNFLRANDIEIAIDDFGTGYSSLSYLMKYEIDFLKIDRSFVGSLTQNKDALQLTESIILLAKKFDIQLIAEGIETQEQLDILNRLGCDFGQGYFLAKPMPAVELISMLRSEFIDQS